MEQALTEDGHALHCRVLGHLVSVLSPCSKHWRSASGAKIREACEACQDEGVAASDTRCFVESRYLVARLLWSKRSRRTAMHCIAGSYVIWFQVSRLVPNIGDPLQEPKSAKPAKLAKMKAWLLRTRVVLLKSGTWLQGCC